MQPQLFRRCQRSLLEHQNTNNCGSSADMRLLRCLLLPALPCDSACSVALPRFALEHPVNAAPPLRDASGRDMAEFQESREVLRDTAEAWHTRRRVPCHGIDHLVIDSIENDERLVRGFSEFFSGNSHSHECVKS